MKKFLLAAIAASAFAAPAFAQSPPSTPGSSVTTTPTITLNGRVVAKCAITGPSAATITADLAGADGFIADGTDAAIKTALNTAGATYAWCSGQSNGVNLTRTPLVKGTSITPVNGFANAVIYDLSISMPDATRSGGASSIEDSTDGTGYAANSISSFGPTGLGSLVTFDSVGTAAPATAGPVAANPTGDYTASSTTRLIAGDYTSTVSITLYPGV